MTFAFCKCSTSRSHGNSSIGSGELLKSQSVRPALFLDRDGVINVDKGYVHRIDDFEFLDGIFDVCRTAKFKGFAIVVVTNQAGIGRGYYSDAQFQTLNNWMKMNFEAEGAPLDAVYYCPFHPHHGVGGYKIDSFDRKPNPGMILRARDEIGIDLQRSILIGDNETDLLAARAAGIGTPIILGEARDGGLACIRIRSLTEAKRIIADLNAL